MMHTEQQILLYRGTTEHEHLISEEEEVWLRESLGKYWVTKRTEDYVVGDKKYDHSLYELYIKITYWYYRKNLDE